MDLDRVFRELETAGIARGAFMDKIRDDFTKAEAGLNKLGLYSVDFEYEDFSLSWDPNAGMIYCSTSKTTKPIRDLPFFAQEEVHAQLAHFLEHCLSTI